MSFMALTPLQRTLAMVAGALLLPVLLVLAYAVADEQRAQRREVERRAFDAAEDLVLLADARAELDLATLRVLATSPLFNEEALDQARLRALGVVETTPNWRTVALIDARTGQVVWTTHGQAPRVAPSDAAPTAGVVEGVERDGAHCPCVRLHMPVPALPGHVLTAFVDPSVYQDMLAAQLPPGAVGGLVDRDGEFVWRSIDHEARVGTPGTSYVREAAARGGRGLYEGRTFEGLVNYTAYATSPTTAWSAHVAVDRSLIDRPRALLRAILFGAAILALLVIGALGAYALHDAAQRAREARRLLELEKAEALGRLTSTVVHDVRNLLAVMQAALNLIARHTQEPRTEEHARSALVTVARGERLMSQLLNFVRDGGGATGPVDVAALVANFDEILRRAVGPRVQLSLSHPPAALAVADADQLELALLNLAINARDAMNGEGSLGISVTALNDAVEITVADTGPGVPEAAREAVFRPFFTTKEFGRGTGLGLAQVESAARQAGGAVRVETAPGGGAAFVIRLRRAESPAAAEPSAFAPVPNDRQPS